MSTSFHRTAEYKQWPNSIKGDIQRRQIKAAVKVNTELLLMYWNLGQRIIEKQRQSSWGEALIPQFAKDLPNAFPGSKGFSPRNLFYIKKWVEFYTGRQIVQQVAAQLSTVENQAIDNRNGRSGKRKGSGKCLSESHAKIPG